jgi:HemX protein
VTSGLAALSGAALGYLGASVGFQWNLFRRQEQDWHIWRNLLWAAFGLHTLALLLVGLSLGHAPLSGMAESLGSLAWVVVGLYLILGKVWKMEVLGAVAAPAAFAMTCFSLLVLSTDPGLNPSKSFWFYLHVGSYMVGYGAFVLAAFCALLYFVQVRLLKAKKVWGMFRLMPSLDALDRAAYRLILAGFPLMLLGLTTGMVMSNWVFAFSDIKNQMVLVTLCVYLAYLHLRLVGGWQGRRVNLLLLVASAFVLLSFLAPGRFHRF